MGERNGRVKGVGKKVVRLSVLSDLFYHIITRSTAIATAGTVKPASFALFLYFLNRIKAR
jgi:hypothetical protein